MILNIYQNGVLVGLLRKLNNGALTFTYDEQWLVHPASRPLSLSIPLTRQTIEGSQIFDFFDNLLPDAKSIRNRIQSRLRIKSSHPFDLLATVGRDCIGAIQLCAPNVKPEIKGIRSQVLSEYEIAQTLNQFDVMPLGMQREEQEFRISLAGAQEKMAFLFWQGQWHRPLGHTPTTHIFKLPIGLLKQHGIDLSTRCENEFLCLAIAKAFGFDVPTTQLAQFENQKVLIVERFDRCFDKTNQTFLRLPTENFCQALGISAQNKYESDGGPNILDCMKLLQGSNNAIGDRETFFKAQILFWLLAAIDGHAKNFSIFLLPNSQYRLTPLYDIMSAYPLFESNSPQKQKAKMAMGLHGKNKQYHWSQIQPRHFISTGKSCGLSPQRVKNMLKEMAEKSIEICDNLPL